MTRESNTPETRCGRDLIPIGGTPLTRENTRQAFKPLADSVQRLEDSTDALADKVRRQQAEVERAREDHARELRELEEYLGRPVTAGEHGAPLTRTTMAQRLDALRKDREDTL
jgi:predicted  nucleic acid-binding Zn-ribbon protein